MSNVHQLGYVVVSKSGERVLSQRYTVREAAEQAMELWRKAGHPEAYIRTVRGLEGPRGKKRAFAAFNRGAPDAA